MFGDSERIPARGQLSTLESGMNRRVLPRIILSLPPLRLPASPTAASSSIDSGGTVLGKAIRERLGFLTVAFGCESPNRAHSHGAHLGERTQGHGRPWSIRTPRRTKAEVSAATVSPAP